MKNLKKKWFSELDRAIPGLSKDVLDAPIYLDARAIEREEMAKKKRFNKLLIASLSSSVAFIICICVTLFMIFNHPGGLTPNDGSYATVIEINPRAMFVADKNGNVISVTALNSDADVILSHSGIVEQLKSQKIDGAMKDFLDYSARLGYISFNLGTAIRITHTCDEEVASSIAGTLESYFMQKGTYSVVYAQPTTIKELSASTDFGECDTVVGLNELVKKSSRLYSERQVLNRTVEEMQSIYTDTILLGEMKDYIKVVLWRGVSSGEFIKEIYLLNKQIANHEDNPNAIFGEYVSSYWTVISSADKESFTDEFKALLSEMEQKLYKFEKIYGKKLDLLSLIASYNLYTSISGEKFSDIENLLSSFTDELYVSTLPVIKDFLMTNGISIDFADGIEVLPETEEEFFKKTEQYLSGVFDSYYEINKVKYESAREEISADDYEAFIDSVIEEYGSVEKYWEHKQKNYF